MTHVRTSPCYPQNNGKIERWHKTFKGECILVKTPLSLEDARQLVTEFVAHYNEIRLHSAIGYVTPADKLAGRDRAIYAERDRKLSNARERRKPAREARRAAVRFQSADCPAGLTVLECQAAWAEDRAPWRHAPSADPGANTEGGRYDAALSFPFGIGKKAPNRLTCSNVQSTLIPNPGFSNSR
jgi:Integrase core domain